MTELLYGAGSRLAVLPPLSPLVVAIVAVAVVGQPLGWIGFLLPLGPVACAVAALAVRRAPDPTWRLTLAFTVVCALLIGGSWILLRIAEIVPALGLAFPVALLAFFLGLVNFVLISISRTIRAWKALPLDYPWIPGWLDRPLGLTPTLKEM